MAAAVAEGTPADAEDLIRRYRDYVVGLVRKLGIPAQDAEDVANDILARELEVGVLDMYDPEFVSVHKGEARKVTFRAFLSHRVSLRVRGKRDQIQRRAGREVLICDAPVDEGGSRWIDVFGGAIWDDYSELDAGEFVSRMREYLATVPRRSAEDSCDLVALFDELLRQINEEGQVTAKAIREHFGVEDTVASAWLARLRQIMTLAGDALPRPEPRVIGGVTLSLADVRTAITLLRDSRGIMVRQPLERAGHPLAGAQKDWYHAFAAEERKLFPELEVDPQTHKKPAGHVKLAVIHRLERMLGIGMADAEAVPEQSPELPAVPEAADEPPTPRELLEARLWASGMHPEQVLECLSLADQMQQVPVTAS